MCTVIEYYISIQFKQIDSWKWILRVNNFDGQIQV